MPREEPRTNIYIMDDELWKWARSQAILSGYPTVSDYVFELIKKDKENAKPDVPVPAVS